MNQPEGDFFGVLRCKVASGKVRFGSLAAVWRPRPSTSAFAPKADVQAGGTFDSRMAANGQKRTFESTCNCHP
jgi:hypothetical protein